MMFASSPFVTDTLCLVSGVLMKWSCHLEGSNSAWLSQNAKRLTRAECIPPVFNFFINTSLQGKKHEDENEVKQGLVAE